MVILYWGYQNNDILQEEHTKIMMTLPNILKNLRFISWTLLLLQCSSHFTWLPFVTSRRSSLPLLKWVTELNWTELKVIAKKAGLAVRLFAVHARLLQSSRTLCNPVDYSLPGSSVHVILPARILEWVSMPSSKASSWPSNQTCVSCIAGGFFTSWTIRETQGSGYIALNPYPSSC